MCMAFCCWPNEVPDALTVLQLHGGQQAVDAPIVQFINRLLLDTLALGDVIIPGRLACSSDASQAMGCERTQL